MKYAPNFFLENNVSPDTLIISKVNEVYMKIESENSIRQELTDYFSFYVVGYKFMPKYKNGMWDGKIRLFNPNNKCLYIGLFPYIKTFAEERNYKLEINDDLELHESFSVEEAREFVNKQDSMKVRDYQLESFIHCIRSNRSLIVSPTASGKSYIIWLLTRWYQDSKVLIIVPTISLVYQMKSDFISYGTNQDDIHVIKSGESKHTDRRIVVSTWQSIYKENKSYFSQYDCVIGDECHLFKAQSLTSIMTNLIDCKYRFGFTGTLDGTQTHRLVLEGLFGKIKQFITTSRLIEKEILSNFEIKCLILKYPKENCKIVARASYKEEMDYLVGNQKRNFFIKNLALSLQGNTLLLFQYVENHGKILYDIILKSARNDRKIFFVYGGTDAETRESIRAITENENDAIIIASYGTFSTGINIRNLHNIIFASPSKSRIRNLQSIGRGLRKSDSKNKAILFDISDDLRHGARVNFTLKHFAERVKIYNEEKFIYKIYNIKI